MSHSFSSLDEKMQAEKGVLRPAAVGGILQDLQQVAGIQLSVLMIEEQKCELLTKRILLLKNFKQVYIEGFLANSRNRVACFIRMHEILMKCLRVKALSTCLTNTAFGLRGISQRQMSMQHIRKKGRGCQMVASTKFLLLRKSKHS